MSDAKMTLAVLDPAEESVVVSRVLVQLHKAIDEAFPTTEVGEKFKRTVFSNEESTETGKMAAPTPMSELESQLAESKAEAPRALERSNSKATRSSASSKEVEPDTRKEFFDGETTGRKPFEHSIESKPDIVTVFAVIVFILGILGVLGFIFLLFG